MQPITLQPGDAFQLGDDLVIARALARGYRVEILPGMIECLARGRFRQRFLVRIDGADYRTLYMSWSEEVPLPWWKRWKLWMYRERNRQY